MLTSTRVSEILVDCLYKDSELIDGIPIEKPVEVIGISNNLGFHPARLASYKHEIQMMLDEFPDEFKKEKGGGWTFLNMCVTKNGEQWTSSQKIMEELCLLSIGNKLGSWLASKELWPVLSGSVPYFVINQ